MSDDCDLDELTAFLEASDDDETEASAGSQCTTTSDDGNAGGQTLTYKDGCDEYDQNKIEAFLQASDDDDDDYDENANNGGTGGRNEVVVANKQRDELDDIEQNSKWEEVGFEEMDQEDLRALEQMMDTQEVVSDSIQDRCPSSESRLNDNTETQSDDEVRDQFEDDYVGNQSGDDNVKNQSDVEVTTAGESDSETGRDEEDDAEQIMHDDIEAEMAAMAKRMEELKALLRKSKSSPESAKKKSKTSPDSAKKKSKTSLDSDRKKSKSSPESAKKKSKTSPDSARKKSKTSLDSDMKKSKSSSDSDRKKSKTSPDSARKKSETSPDSDRKKSKSSPSSMKKHSKASPILEKIQSTFKSGSAKTHSNASPSSGKKQSISKSESALKHFKTSPNSDKNQSKYKIDYAKNHYKSSHDYIKKHSITSPDSDKTQSKPNVDRATKHFESRRDSVPKGCSPDSSKKQRTTEALLDQGDKNIEGRRHGAEIVSKSRGQGHPESNVKDTLPNRKKADCEQKRKAREEEEDESNPFFAKRKDMHDPSPSQPATSFCKEEPPVDSKTLFGDSDDSDWEDLAGDEKSKLSDEGRELKKIISSGHKKREAHTPSYDTTVLKKPDVSRWTDTTSKPIRLHPIQHVQQKPALNPETGTVSGKYKVRDEYMQKSTNLAKEDERETVTDPFCGIRIINPRIPMDVFRTKMEGRNLIKISRLLSKLGTPDLQRENWVTIGVVVHKSEPRQSAAGKAYCIWKLSDLHYCDKTVTFFLFGNVYKEHWKNDLGVVIGLLNPSVMDKAEKNQSEIAITINHPQQLLIMGISKDLGRCRGTTKAGQPCSAFINKMQGEYCTYHVQSAYRKTSSKRTELQASTGVTPKAFTQQKNKNGGCFFYGGNTYTTQRPQAKSSKDTMTMKKLQSFEANKVQGKITTMSIHELGPEDEKRIQKLREKDKDLLNLLSFPSAGSMNFVKHLVKKDATPAVKKDGSDDAAMPLASAKDLLKEHSKTLQQQKQQVALLGRKPTLGKGFSMGQEISLDAPVKKGKGLASADLAKQLAIARVKSKGGINKANPNTVRNKVMSPEAKEKIKKRVANDMDLDVSSEDADSKEPPMKKSKLLGDIDLNSPEVQHLLKKKSKHKGALAEAEAEHTERYFSVLEKKEQMEDKMGSIMEVPVKLFHCLQCKYRFFSVHERCKKENHTIRQTKGVKRFFKCKQCKRRTVSIEKMPTNPCKQCGNAGFERVSMLKERRGPKLESEELCLRGNEQKFIGSLQGNASFNG